MINKILKATTIIALMSSMVYAKDVKPKDTTKTPKNWWQIGSYEYPTTDKVLMHFQGSISYAKKGGNDRDKKVKADTFIKIRKKHFGVSVLYSKIKDDKISYEDKSSKPKTSTTDNYSIHTKVGYDINEDFFLTVGYVNSRDLLFEIYNKTTRYAGVGYRIFKSKFHRLSIFGAFGDEDISFGTYPQLPSGKTSGQYYEVNYLVFLSPMIAFKTSYQYLKADEKNRDTAVFSVATKLSITQTTSFIVSFTDEFIDAQKTVNRYSHDQTIYSSIQFSF